MQSKPEVVITGLGAVTPAGGNAKQTWENLRHGQQCVSTLQVGTGQQQATYTVGQITDFSPPVGLAQVDRSIQFAARAAEEALAHAGLTEDSNYRQSAACVFSASKPASAVFTGLHQACIGNNTLPAISAVTEMWLNSCCVAMADRFRLIGPRLCLPVACATGSHAIIRAAQLIHDGDAQSVLAGATEASLMPLYLAAFARMGVLAKDISNPGQACKPFDRRRSGFVPGEGAAAVFLESAQSARKRGAKVLARITAWWQGMQALDLFELEADGRSLAKGIGLALERAGLAGTDIDYICAHGTGTKANDAVETAAIKVALDQAAQQVSISSHKGAIGHLLGAAGALQVLITVISMSSDEVPPTVNLLEPDPLCDLDYTAGTARRRTIRHALCIAGGFGGQSGVMVLSKP